MTPRFVPTDKPPLAAPFRATLRWSDHRAHYSLEVELPAGWTGGPPDSWRIGTRLYNYHVEAWGEDGRCARMQDADYQIVGADIRTWRALLRELGERGAAGTASVESREEEALTGPRAVNGIQRRLPGWRRPGLGGVSCRCVPSGGAAEVEDGGARVDSAASVQMREMAGRRLARQLTAVDELKRRAGSLEMEVECAAAAFARLRSALSEVGPLDPPDMIDMAERLAAADGRLRSRRIDMRRAFRRRAGYPS